jgi:hypothetical protein
MARAMGDSRLQPPSSGCMRNTRWAFPDGKNRLKKVKKKEQEKRKNTS